MLSLTHDSGCEAAAFPKDTIKISDIAKHKLLIRKFLKTTKKTSKFYGCYTKEFARTWNSVFGVPTAGAEEKIDFGVINRHSNIINVMERIEKTPTSRGLPDWTEFK